MKLHMKNIFKVLEEKSDSILDSEKISFKIQGKIKTSERIYVRKKKILKVSNRRKMILDIKSASTQKNRRALKLLCG